MRRPGELSSARREEPQREMPLEDGREDGWGGYTVCCGGLTTADTPGARLPPVYRFSSLA
jgi:hypothetical protein